MDVDSQRSYVQFRDGCDVSCGASLLREISRPAGIRHGWYHTNFTSSDTNFLHEQREEQAKDA